MKRKSLIVISLIVLMSLIAFVSCSDNAGESSSEENSILVKSASQVFKDISGLKNFKANISSSTAAVGKQEGAVSRDASRSLDSYLNYLLVKVDEGSSQAEPVTFTANSDTKINGRTIHAGDMITQDKLTGSVDKVYVIGDYTLVSFLTVDALTLINSKDTKIESDSYSTRYCGNLNFETRNDSNNGGINEYIWYEYRVPNNKRDEEMFYLNYSYRTWWHDSSGRYNDESIEYNEQLTLRCACNNIPAFNEYNGVAIYDTFDYYTSDFRSSFIIDNNTGLIYAIPYGKGDNQMNLSVHQGVVIDKNLGPVKLSINGNGELKLEQILANKSVYIYDVFKDAYDQYYIRTDSLSETDGDVKFYNVCGEYIPTEDGRVMHVTYNNSVNLDSNWAYQITGLSFVGENFAETPVLPTDEVVIDHITYVPDNNDYRLNSARGLYDYNEKNGFQYWEMNNTLTSGAKARFQRIEDGTLYLQGVDSNNLYATEYNLETKDSLFTRFYGYNSGTRFALLDGKNCLVAKKQSNSLYTLCIFNPSKSIAEDNWNRSITYSNGVQEWIYNNEDEQIWRFAYENDMAMIFEPYYDSEQYRWIYASTDREWRTEYYNITINGENKALVFDEGYDYESVKNAYLKANIIETPILSNVTVSDWKGYGDAFTMTFNVTSKSGTDSYKIVKDGVDNYKVVLAGSSFVETKTLTLQPINR